MKLIELFPNYFVVRQELMELACRLSQEQLDWTPPNHKSSIGRLLGHIAETEYWWISILALEKEKYSEEVFERFEQARTLKQLVPLLEETLGDFTDFLRNEDVEDWDQIHYDYPQDKIHVTKQWLVWHVVEHQARHRGQILMLARMQGLEFDDV